MDELKKYDLTQGPIGSRLMAMSLPVIGSQIIQMLYNLTDMFWLGKVGSDAVAAAGSAGMYMWLFFALVIIGNTGAQIGVSQRLGAKDENLARKYAQNSLFISFWLSILCVAAMCFFSDGLISFFAIKEANVAQDASNYLAIAGLGCPAVFVSAALGGTFIGAGNSRLPMVANSAGLVTNVILDPLFIYVYGWGVEGAAIATTIAQYVVCAVFLVAIKLTKGRPFRKFSFFEKVDKDNVKQLFNWGTPVALENFFFSAFAMLLTRIVASFGSDAIAVYRLASQIESLSYLVSLGFGFSFTSFVGQNFGAKQWTRIHKGFRISLIVAVGWGIFVVPILFFCGGFLFSLFLSKPHAVEMGASYLRIIGICQIGICFESVARGIFRGTGKTYPPSLVCGVCNAARVPLAYMLSRTALGLDGVWVGIAAGVFVRSAWMFIWSLKYKKTLPAEDKPTDGYIINAESALENSI